MAYGYIQTFLQFPNAKNGSLYIYVANSTSPANVYDPVNANIISQPLSIDSDGYCQQFWVDTDNLYDMDVRTFNGQQVETRNNVSVLGGSACATGPQGPQGVTGPAGPAGPAGPSGRDGVDGINGTDGINGVDGTDGVSLLTIMVNPESDYGNIIYNKSDNESVWYNAGNVLPDGIGKVAPEIGATLKYLNDCISSDSTITLTKSSTGVNITAPIVSDLATRLTAAEADIVALDLRVDALETESIHKSVIFGGVIGETSVVIAHGMGTSNIVVSCYDATTNASIYLNVQVTDTHITVSDLAPLTINNQIKFVIIR